MNPALQQLGYGPRDRVVIIHADDIGMCQATLSVLADLLDGGLVSSAAVMVPCPWFPQVAAFCRDHPTVDMGVHLTVNAEWAAYRWGPLSTRDPASGLLDAAGYFHADPPTTWQQADPQAVATELRAQVTQALRAGIDVTHVDTHMGTVIRPPLLPAYLAVAREHRLPLFFLGDAARLRAAGLPPELVAEGEQCGRELVAAGIPVFDALAALPLDDPTDHVTVAKRIIDGLPPGLSVLLLHPAQDTPELRALAPDWPSRVANAAAGRSLELRAYVRQAGVQVIGYRPLRELLRAHS
ncbi:MAG TPA: polysaccharide deacetylase family protein [Chloroflexia bacterium]|nr:polysaccharide deacetylase family protein [Chloroflexia bacterium]